MLDKKDKIIFELLLQNCRIPISKLAKITKLTKPTILYRINKLEKDKIIEKYDAILNYNLLKYKLDFFIISVKSDDEKTFLKEILKFENLETLNKLYHYKNYFLSLVFKTKTQKKEFIKFIKKYDKNYQNYLFENIEFLPFQIFDIKNKNNIENLDKRLNLKENKIIPKIIKLDKIDLLLLEKLSNGYAKTSILNLSILLNINYHTLLYKFKRLKKNGYFLKFTVQPSANLTQNDIILLKLENMEFDKITKKLKTIKFIPFIIKLNDNNYYLQILTTSIQEYKKAIEQISLILENEILVLQILNLKKTIIVNKYPFNYYLK